MTRGLGKQPLVRHNKTLLEQDAGERSSDATRDWASLACECHGISSGGGGGQWPAVEVSGTDYNSPGGYSMLV